MIAVALALAGAEPAPVCAPPSSGAWHFQQPQYPSIGSRLVLRRSGGAWSATVHGRPLTASVTSGRIELRSHGTLRFRGPRLRRAVHGFWFEPKTAFDHARAFAMDLLPLRTGGWIGRVGAGQEPIGLNVWLLTGAKGRELLARNPDGSIGDARFTVIGGECALDLQDINGADHHARLSIAGDGSALLQGLDERLPSIALTPAAPPVSDASANARDDLTETSPASVGIDGKLLAALIDKISHNDPTQRGAPLIHSILVARHGRLVAEHYFAGYGEGDQQQLRSLSKSFVPLLVGAAMTHGMAIAGATTLGETLPDYAAILRADPAKARITLDQLLAMRSGLACNDFDDVSPGNEDRMQAQTEQPDWYRFFLDLPVANPAGSHYAYCSAGTHLAAAIVAARARRSALELFDNWLAKPLGIKTYSLPLDPSGRAYFGGGATLRPRDVLKFGQLVLDGGRWHGRQIVDAAWLNHSISCPPAEPACSEGFGWHFNRIQTNGRTYREVEANGNGGQLLMIYPQLDLVVLVTAANYNAYPVWRKFRDELVPQYILAALKL